MLNRIKISKHGMKVWILPFILLDVALFPVSHFYSMSYSIILVMLANIVFIKVNPFRKRIFVDILLFIVMLSTANAMISKDRFVLQKIVDKCIMLDVYKEDLKYCVYIFIGIAIYKVAAILYLKYSDEVENKINKILVICCLCYLLLGIIFMFDVNLLIKIREIYFNSSIDDLSNLVLVATGYFNRYNFLLLDPNNAGYFISIITIYLNENVKLNKTAKIIVWLTLLMNPILTMSSGNLGVLIIYLFAKIILNYKKNLSIVKVRKTLLLIILASTLLIILVFCRGEIFQTALTRLLSNSASSRLNIYINYFQYKKPGLIGNGYTFIKDGLVFSPHSDHLRILYGYGILSYILIFVLIIRKKIITTTYLFLIPAFIAFSINSILDEKRLFFTFLIILAIENTKNNILLRRKMYDENKSYS